MRAVVVTVLIRKAVKEHPFSVNLHDPAMTLTASLGFAIAAPELLKKADNALTGSKPTGRNRVRH